MLLASSSSSSLAVSGAVSISSIVFFFVVGGFARWPFVGERGDDGDLVVVVGGAEDVGDGNDWLLVTAVVVVRVDEESDCVGLADGFVLVGCCGEASLGVGGEAVDLVTVPVLGGTGVLDLVLVCVAMDVVVVGALPGGDASRLRRIVLAGSTVGSLPAIDSWATCFSI